MNPITPSPRFTAVLLATGALLAGCGSSSSSSQSTTAASSGGTSASASGGGTPAPAPATSKHVSVSIAKYAYAPVKLTVSPGTRITFTNHDATAHTATAPSPHLDTGSIGPNQSGSVTVTQPGTYSYICSFHPFMRGTIVVR